MSISDLKDSSDNTIELIKKTVIQEYSEIEDYEWCQDVSEMISTMIRSIEKQEDKLRSSDETLPEEYLQHEYEEFLGEQYESLQEFKHFVFGLGFVALHKKLEIHTKRMQKYSDPHRLTGNPRSLREVLGVLGERSFGFWGFGGSFGSFGRLK